MSNQSPQNLELPDLSDLKPLQDQNLNGVDASMLKFQNIIITLLQN